MFQKNKMCNTRILIMLALTIFVLAAAISGCSRDNEISEYERDDHDGKNEESSITLTLNDTYDMVRNGARLILSYDKQSNSFKGTVENTTGDTLTRVRVEVHLSNGIELDPTTPMDLAPSEKVDVTLPATNQAFNGWTAHTEVGGDEHSVDDG